MRLTLLAAVLAALTLTAILAHDEPRATTPGPPVLPKTLPPGPYDGQPAAIGDAR